ncbi:MAG TPA: hypothetical protein VFA45_22600 [Actinomycetes bacterium]|nr:hypothetical protein [Actinomycetes bacterium]
MLVLAGGWQTSRQSAYSVATRCVEELHVYLDAVTQQTGAYRDADPVQTLSQRWTRDATKRAATSDLNRTEYGGPPGRAEVEDDLVVAPPEPVEFVPARSALELSHGRDLGGGLGIDP